MSNKTIAKGSSKQYVTNMYVNQDRYRQIEKVIKRSGIREERTDEFGNSYAVMVEPTIKEVMYALLDELPNLPDFKLTDFSTTPKE